MLSPEQSVMAAIALCGAGALITLLLSRNKTAAGWAACLATTGGASFVLGGVWRVLTAGSLQHPVEFWSVPQLGLAVRFYVDGLTAVFLLLTAVIAALASLYAIAYMRHYKEYGVVRFYPYFLLFLAGIYGLLSTTDTMWVFFVFWQLMTLPSYALIRFEYRKAENLRAANKYLILMQIACAAVMLGAALLAPHGMSASQRYEFDTISASLPALLTGRPALVTAAFALFLIGFGIKMGMWPFGQIWLPDAHPAAPSPVSAMLSGVVIKTGVYGLLRVFLWLTPVSAQANYLLSNWGIIVAVLGTITLFTGTMQALRQEQSKRLLAFSSIGQIGYIVFAMGCCMCLLGAGTPMATSLATVALTGALLHVLSHGLFKGLLFLNAGSMLQATGTQDLNKMGGLMKFMPLTGITVLVASLSIAGVPLTSAFVSKWTMFVAAIEGAPFAGFLPLCAAVGILTSAVTLALFLKFYGAAFLSRTSALVVQRSREHGRLEVGWLMQVPQLLLASFSLVLGILPVIGFQIAHRALENSRQGFGAVLASNVPVDSGIASGLLEITSTALFVPLALAAVIVLTFLLAFAISRIGQSRRRAAAPWLCGYAREAECHRYVASNFYGEITRYLGRTGGQHAPRTHA